jgi:hypothetical protein
MRSHSHKVFTLALAALALAAMPVNAQREPAGGLSCCPPEPVVPGMQRSSNIKLMSHVPIGARQTVSDIDIEQELTRPYAYVTRGVSEGVAGFEIIDVRDPSKAKRIYSWQIEDVALHRGLGGLNPMYFKHKGRYYLTVGFQFVQGGPNADLGAIVFDVTSLPDVTRIREVGRIRAPYAVGGFHETFMYRHSSGRPLLFTTAQESFGHIYDMEKFLAGDANHGLIGKVPVPEGAWASRGDYTRAYHDMYVGYDVQTRQDKFYGGGVGGYYVFDVSRPEEPKMITAITGMSGVGRGHTFTPDPLGRFAIAETEYQYAPLRVVDLKPKGDGTSFEGNISRPIGAWTANWKNLAHNHEVRWPYVFVSAYEDGLAVVNMMDPTNPITVGYYDTYEGPHATGACGGGICSGAFGVDVRNADGLIVISDMDTGFWAFKMEGFDGWNGKDWGMPNISSAQDWDNGPEGAPRPARPVTLR